MVRSHHCGQPQKSQGEGIGHVPCAQMPVTSGLFYTILSNCNKEMMLQRESHTPSKILMVAKQGDDSTWAQVTREQGVTFLLQTQLYFIHFPASAVAAHHQCSWEPNYTSRTHLHFRKKRRALPNPCSNCHSPCCMRFNVLQIWWRGRQEKKNWSEAHKIIIFFTYWSRKKDLQEQHSSLKK